MTERNAGAIAQRNTGFVDKYGISICVGDTVKYSVMAQVATRVTGRGANSVASPIRKECEAVGVVKFGMWKMTVDEIATYYIQTNAETRFTDYVEQGGRVAISRRLDLVEVQKAENLSAMLTKRLAAKSEVMGVEHD